MLRLTLAAFGLLLIISTANAEYRRYPNAVPDTEAQASMTELLKQLTVDPATKTSVFITFDTFEEVLTFYQQLGREYTVSFPSRLGARGYERELPSRVEIGPGGLNQVPSGIRLKQAFIIFDGASDVTKSMDWMVIMRPLITEARNEGSFITYGNVRDVTGLIHMRKS